MERSSSASAVPDHRQLAYPTLAGGKRYIDRYDCYIPSYDETLFRQSKRPRLASRLQQEDRPAFFIIKEAGDPCVVPDRSPHGMGAAARSQVGEVYESVNFAARGHNGSVYQRTPSGFSPAVEDGTLEKADGDLDSRLDDLAARMVQRHISQRSRRGRNTKVERVLRSLISPRSPGQEFTLDNDALESIFYAANEIFFFGSLKGRVDWDWSDRSNAKFCSTIIGTTALREAAHTGEIETLIILSHHYLRDKRYSRRLLISTFLHEMIHSYMFVRCGHSARRCGGHTEGFRRIAKLIDIWAGPETLFLSNMEADLDAFRQTHITHDHDDVHSSCNLQLPRHDDWAPPMARSRSAWPDIR
ncbi:hypothetical protein PG994_009247 [Apiospora phragmitis]|uniref:SprT-like domain-containing protein n=1 Tax=Apiospora phragmitis TaxID=2905665 RepID=A0ABR1UIQ9_9PEZI